MKSGKMQISAQGKKPPIKNPPGRVISNGGKQSNHCGRGCRPFRPLSPALSAGRSKTSRLRATPGILSTNFFATIRGSPETEPELLRSFAESTLVICQLTQYSRSWFFSGKQRGDTSREHRAIPRHLDDMSKVEKSGLGSSLRRGGLQKPAHYLIPTPPAAAKRPRERKCSEPRHPNFCFGFNSDRLFSFNNLQEILPVPMFRVDRPGRPGESALIEKGEQKANREPFRLEINVTHTKQKPGLNSNREKEEVFHPTNPA